ncbi:unnamed protein product [Calypogeia fissa]
MASSKMVLAVAVTLLAMVAVSNAACPAAYMYAPCMPFLLGQGAMQSGCCTMLDNTDAGCLCAIAMNPPIKIDFDTAIGMPKACGRKVPAGTVCDGKPVPSA